MLRIKSITCAAALACTILVSMQVTGCCWIPLVHENPRYNEATVSALGEAKASISTAYKGSIPPTPRQLGSVLLQLSSTRATESECRCNKPVVKDIDAIIRSIREDSTNLAQYPHGAYWLERADRLAAALDSTITTEREFDTEK